MSQYPPPPPGYYGQPTPQTSSDAVLALVLAVLSWFFCPFVLAVVALLFAGKASRAIRASGGWVDGSGLVLAAQIVAWINIAVAVLIAGLFLLFFIFAMGASDSSVGGGSVEALALLVR